jgi:hypothetical protein
MISFEQLVGGAQRITAGGSVVVSKEAPRTLVCQSVPTLRLADADQIRFQGLRYMILNDTGGSVAVVQDSDSAAIATVPDGGVGWVFVCQACDGSGPVWRGAALANRTGVPRTFVRGGAAVHTTVCNGEVLPPVYVSPTAPGEEEPPPGGDENGTLPCASYTTATATVNLNGCGAGACQGSIVELPGGSMKRLPGTVAVNVPMTRDATGTVPFTFDVTTYTDGACTTGASALTTHSEEFIFWSWSGNSIAVLPFSYWDGTISAVCNEVDGIGTWTVTTTPGTFDCTHYNHNGNVASAEIDFFG